MTGQYVLMSSVIEMLIQPRLPSNRVMPIVINSTDIPILFFIFCMLNFLMITFAMIKIIKYVR